MSINWQSLWIEKLKASFKSKECCRFCNAEVSVNYGASFALVCTYRKRSITQLQPKKTKTKLGPVQVAIKWLQYRIYIAYLGYFRYTVTSSNFPTISTRKPEHYYQRNWLKKSVSENCSAKNKKFDCGQTVKFQKW